MIAYTDGACFPNPGKGGWSYVLTEDNKLITSLSGSQTNSTNNRMEYLAAIKALEDYGHSLKSIKTDSMLLVNTAMVWRHSWKNKGWKRKKNKEPKNIDLVIKLSDLLDKYKVNIEWVKGHNGDEFNEIADDLANEAAVNGEGK